MGSDELNKTQLEERLLGVSATGWRQLFDLLGWETASSQVIHLQTLMREWANDEATKYSNKLGIPRPLLVTTIKPEGSGSKVFGSSEGLHWDWAPYSILRIEASSNDALAKTLKEQGFPWYPKPYEFSSGLAAGLEGSDVWEKIKSFKTSDASVKDSIYKASKAVLFEFPLKSESSVSQGEVPAIEQLENVQSFADHYTDHIPSSTITVKPEEWDDVAEWVHNNWKDFATAAFLAYWSGNFPLLPKEDINEGQYLQLVSQFDEKYIVGKSFVVNEGILALYEQDALSEGVDIDDVDLGQGCSTGACPLR